MFHATLFLRHNSDSILVKNFKPNIQNYGYHVLILKIDEETKAGIYILLKKNVQTLKLKEVNERIFFHINSLPFNNYWKSKMIFESAHDSHFY